MSNTRKLTAAEEMFIQNIEGYSNGKSMLTHAGFIASLKAEITKGLARGDQGRIGFGDDSFIAAFQQRLIDTQKLSTQTIYDICDALFCDGKYKAFIGDPIRSSHLFSNLYGELVKRHNLNLDVDPAEIKIPKEIEALNYGVLDYFKNDLFKNGGSPLQTLANDVLQKSHTRTKDAVNATSAESLRGMIEDNVASKEQVEALTQGLAKKPADIPQEYFDSLPKNKPVPDRKAMPDMASPLLSGLRKQFKPERAKSDPRLFSDNSSNSRDDTVKAVKTSSSAPGILEKRGKK